MKTMEQGKRVDSSVHNPIVFLRDIEMSSTASTSTETMNYLAHSHHENSTNKDADLCTHITPDGRTVTIRKKPRLDQTARDGMLFDAIGTQFHANVFFYQLFIHLFFPLIFTVKNKYGQGLRMRLWNIIWNIVAPIVVYLMIGTYFGCSFSDQDLLGQSIFIPLMFYVVHRCILSLKYASLSATEYERFVDCKDHQMTLGYVSQMHVTGWIELDPSVLHFEIGAASARIGCKINEMYMYICESSASSISSESQFRYWNAFLRGHDTIDWDSKPAPEIKTLPSGRLGVSVYNIVHTLVLRASANDSHPYYIYFLVYAIVSLMVAISYVPLFMNWNSIDDKVSAVVFQISSTIVNAQFGFVFFALLLAAIIDIQRQKRMVEILHCMIRSTDLMMHNVLSILPLNQMVAAHCRDVAKARLNAILSITDDYEIVPNSNPSLKTIAEEHDDADDEETKDFRPRGSSFTPEFEALNEGDEESKERESEVLGENIAQEAAYAVTPRVSFRYQENVMAWLFARLTIQHFGDRFRNRFDYYIGASLGLTLFLMLFALITVFTASNSKEAFASVFFLQSFLVVTLLLFYLVLIFSLGSSVNEGLEVHRKTLMIRAVKIRSKIQCLKMYRPTSEEIESLEEVLENIAMAKEAIEVNNELKPLQILGFNAQSAFTVTIITAAISFYSTLLTLYFKGGSLSTVESTV